MKKINRWLNERMLLPVRLIAEVFLIGTALQIGVVIGAVASRDDGRYCGWVPDGTPTVNETVGLSIQSAAYVCDGSEPGH